MTSKSSASVAGDDEDGVALHGRDGQPRVLDPHPHDPVRAGERVLHVVGIPLAADDVARDPVELQGCSGGQRLLHVDDRRERVVVHVDQLDRVDGLGARLGDDHGDRLADEPDPVGRERRPGAVRVDLEEQVPRGQVQVGGREDADDTRRRASGLDVGDMDPRVGEGTSYEREVEGAVDHQVVDVVALALHEIGVLDARDRVAHQ